MSLKTALYTHHQDNKAKIIDFAGFELPVWFSSIKEEHLSVRQDVGAFDISHMGVILFKGTGAKAFLQKVSCNDIEKASGNKMVYSMILNQSGMVLDDIMVGQLEEDYIMVVNASNRAKILAWFDEISYEDLEILSLENSHGFLAVQGPNAIQKLEGLFDLNLSDRPRFSVFYETIKGISVMMMRTGYTGEDGCEIVVSHEAIDMIWSELMKAGITPCGLGARDTLRMEVGLPLYGQELSETIHPLMTRYKWVLKFDTDFIGKEALLALREQPQEYATVGLEMIDRGIPRTGYPIQEGGYVTSGTQSPSLNKGIAMAMVKAEYSDLGTMLNVEIRGKLCKATVVKIPFV